MRVIIIGGPRSGKSTLAKRLSLSGAIHYCTDPKSLVKDVLPNVNYLPEGLNWGDDSQYVIDNWFSKNGNWVIEGVGAIRALRKWRNNEAPCDKILFIKDSFPGIKLLDGQASMHKSIHTIWNEISGRFNHITQII